MTQPSRSRLGFLAIVICAAGMTAPAAGQTLISHWKMDDTSGSTLVDSEPGGYDALLTPGFTLNQPGAGASCGSAVEFDALSMTRATFPTDNTWDLLEFNVSVSVWVRPLTPPPGTNVGRIFGNDDSGWSCGYRANDLIFTTRFIFDYLSPAFSMPVDAWTHLVFVFDANFDVTFYANGQLIGTVPGPGPATINGSQWIIGNLDSTGTIDEHIDAQLDSLQVYSGLLSAQDVTSLFQNPCAALGGSVGSNFCLSSTNSTGTNSAISGTGSASITANDLILSANGQPSQPGIFIAGPTQAQVPFFNGFLCVDPAGLQRFVSVATPVNGVSTESVDIATSAAGGLNVSAGASYYFQRWFRDPAAGGGNANFSDGLEVLYVP